eukprot:8170344-Pyramimonas_sp.AAC.1
MPAPDPQGPAPDVSDVCCNCEEETPAAMLVRWSANLKSCLDCKRNYKSFMAASTKPVKKWWSAKDKAEKAKWFKDTKQKNKDRDSNAKRQWESQDVAQEQGKKDL